MGAGAVRVAVGRALPLVLTACGQPDHPARSEPGQPDTGTPTPGPDGTRSVEVDAGDDFRFHPAVINAGPGPVRLTLANVGNGAPPTRQAPQLPGASGPLTTAGQHNSRRFTIGRPDGYRFLCAIHEAKGQVERLVVASK